MLILHFNLIEQICLPISCAIVCKEWTFPILFPPSVLLCYFYFCLPYYDAIHTHTHVIAAWQCSPTYLVLFLQLSHTSQYHSWNSCSMHCFGSRKLISHCAEGICILFRASFTTRWCHMCAGKLENCSNIFS